MNDWKPYPRNRKIVQREGYVLIVPEDMSLSKMDMPLFCEVCQICFSNKEDKNAYKQFKCCSACADDWAYSHKEKWLNGWRPDADKIKKIVENRVFINSSVLFE